MDIGSEFDDDFFEKPREKQENKEPRNFEAKVCMPLWYMESSAVGKDPSDKLIALKHQADYYYFSQKYPKAAEAYEHCLQLVPPSNSTWKREFLENLSRSHLHIGNIEKALEWSLKLHEFSFSTDQKLVSMNLLAVICHKLGKYKEELEALHCCIEAHKLCPEFWLRLGRCYAGLFKIDLPGSSVHESNLENHEPCCAFSTKSVSQSLGKQEEFSPSLSSEERAIASSSCSSHCKDTNSSVEGETEKCEVCSLGVQIVSSCLIRTRTLIDSGGQNPLCGERDEKIKKEISSSLNHMEVDQSFIDVASSMLGTDFLSGLQEYSDNSVVETHECISGKLKDGKSNG